MARILEASSCNGVGPVVDPGVDDVADLRGWASSGSHMK